MELAQHGSVKGSPTRQAVPIAAIKRLSAIVLGALVGVGRALPSLLAAWRRHAEEQRYLCDLNDYCLRDLGLSRSDVAGEGLSAPQTKTRAP
jgi:uncharacterized protein YjiS (DUF1127 family)